MGGATPCSCLAMAMLAACPRFARCLARKHFRQVQALVVGVRLALCRSVAGICLLASRHKFLLSSLFLSTPSFANLCYLGGLLFSLECMPGGGALQRTCRVVASMHLLSELFSSAPGNGDQQHALPGPPCAL